MNYTETFDNTVWSVSTLNLYWDCPFALYLKKIEEREGESNYYAENGKCMHSVFEAILKNEIDISECTKFYADNYELICETTKQSTMDNTYEKCMDYLCNIDGFDSEKYEIIGVEQELRFKIGKYDFVGYADLVARNKENGKVILVDHKQASHFLKKDGTPLKNQMDSFIKYKHQMYVYCKGIKDCLGFDVDQMVWHHFKDDGKLSIIPFDNGEYEETLQWAVDTIETIKNDKKFDCKKSYMMCSFLCNYRNDCEYKDEEEE